MAKKNETDDEVCMVLRIARNFNEMVGEVVRGDADDDDVADRLEESKRRSAT
jgi:hypothetical protein